MRTILFAIALSFASPACGDNTAPETPTEPCDAPDAAGSDCLPLCASVGCPTAAICNRDGSCHCDADGSAVACTFAATDDAVAP